MVIAIDLSEDGPRVVALVGAREHVLKSRGFLYATSWIKHFREIPSRMKVSYLRKFVRHYPRISRFLTHVKILREASYLPSFVEQVKPSLILVDNKLVKHVENLGIYIVTENSVRYRHHERLMLLADNLANYFRILLKSDPKRFREELRRFEK